VEELVELRAALYDSFPWMRGREGPADDRFADEAYDGLGPYELNDLLDWQMYAVELPAPERSGHRELSDAQIARWAGGGNTAAGVRAGSRGVWAHSPRRSGAARAVPSELPIPLFVEAFQSRLGCLLGCWRGLDASLFWK
jgi:hypothetical protein